MSEYTQRQLREAEEKQHRSIAVSVIGLGLIMTQRQRLRNFHVNKTGWHTVLHVKEQYLLLFMHVLSQVHAVQIVAIEPDGSKVIVHQAKGASKVERNSLEMMARGILRKAINRILRYKNFKFESKMLDGFILQYEVDPIIADGLKTALNYAPVSISLKRATTLKTRKK